MKFYNCFLCVFFRVLETKKFDVFMQKLDFFDQWVLHISIAQRDNHRRRHWDQYRPLQWDEMRYKIVRQRNPQRRWKSTWRDSLMGLMRPQSISFHCDFNEIPSGYLVVLVDYYARQFVQCRFIMSTIDLLTQLFACSFCIWAMQPYVSQGTHFVKPNLSYISNFSQFLLRFQYNVM